MNVPPGRLVSSTIWKGSKLMSLISPTIDVLFWDDCGVFDFFPSNEARVLFLTEADIISDESALRRRLVKGCRVDQNLRKVVLIQKTTLTSEKYIQFQNFAAIDLGLSVIPVNTIEEASQILKQMVNCEARKDANPFRLKPKIANSPDEDLLKTLQIVPGFGSKKVFKALEKYGSLDQIINSSQADLGDVVELSTASKAYQFFNNKF